MNKEPPAPQPHLWDGTPMAAMPYVISKGNETPDHRVYEGMNMSKAERLAEALHGNAKQPWTREEVAAELRRLSAINAELLDALEEIIADMDSDFGTGYDYDKARAAIAKAQGEQL